jgi:Mg-chelatase subunit ChlD
MSSLAAFLTVLILRVARIVGITILVSVFVACLLGQGPTAPIKAATTVSSVPAAAGSEIPPVKAASEQLIPVVMPLAVFLDISNSGNSKTFEIAERNRIAELLSACPEGTPISVITFNRNAALLFSGRISTPAVVTLMESLDQAKRGGPTDLWRAVEAAHSQSCGV